MTTEEQREADRIRVAKRRAEIKAASTGQESQPLQPETLTVQPKIEGDKGKTWAEYQAINNAHKAYRHSIKACAIDTCPDVNTKLYHRAGNQYYICQSHSF